ncbi:MAG: response regulator [Planctomycetota bacterium]
MRVLIVEDSNSIRLFLRHLVQELGHEVVGEAPDGREGIEQFRKLRPDFTLMDINMPVMDGVAALKKIKEFSPEARVVMLTSTNSATTVLECVREGLLNYILKDLPRAELLAELRATFERVSEPSPEPAP